MPYSTVLGLDFGERRIGVSLSDSQKCRATGLTTIDRRRHPDWAAILSPIIREESVDSIVVGYPLRTDGKKMPGDKTEAVDAFIAELEKKFHLPVFREDESFTSSLAQDALKARGGARAARRNKKARTENKEAVDRLAACFILQDFLDRKGQTP